MLLLALFAPARFEHAAVPFVVASDDPKAREFTVRARARAGPSMAVSNLVAMHYNALVALKGAIERAGSADKEAVVDALAGLTFSTPSGPMTIGADHHTTMNMFLPRTQGADLVQLRALGEMAPVSGCRPDQFVR